VALSLYFNIVRGFRTQPGQSIAQTVANDKWTLVAPTRQFIGSQNQFILATTVSNSVVVDRTSGTDRWTPGERNLVAVDADWMNFLRRTDT